MIQAIRKWLTVDRARDWPEGRVSDEEVAAYQAEATVVLWTQDNRLIGMWTDFTDTETLACYQYVVNKHAKPGDRLMPAGWNDAKSAISHWMMPQGAEPQNGMPARLRMPCTYCAERRGVARQEGKRYQVWHP